MLYCSVRCARAAVTGEGPAKHLHDVNRRATARYLVFCPCCKHASPSSSRLLSTARAWRSTCGGERVGLQDGAAADEKKSIGVGRIYGRGERGGVSLLWVGVSQAAADVRLGRLPVRQGLALHFGTVWHGRV